MFTSPRSGTWRTWSPCSSMSTGSPPWRRAMSYSREGWYNLRAHFRVLDHMRVVGAIFGSGVVHGREDYGAFVRIMVGGCSGDCEFVGLLLQNLFYYVDKNGD
ncbi:hypothetical protein D8674_017389 [Pyrus ussuriensis x Pyrus communis]|uniref:Uncharacterized protein n=1 Tax=Pyrus ussuriensis x Pyrus communis TaxID=2448454 RepID=A0A5N5HCJ9_9ROSA|nr:hypothetical protein D8674_017389 [Pyrus ussuriensis x Pyrus communis]